MEKKSMESKTSEKEVLTEEKEKTGEDVKALKQETTKKKQSKASRKASRSKAAKAATKPETKKPEEAAATEVKAEVKEAAKAEAKPETDEAAKAETKEAAKAEAKPETDEAAKAEAKPETDEAAKTEAKPETDEAAKAEAKPETEETAKRETEKTAGKPDTGKTAKEVTKLETAESEKETSKPEAEETAKGAPKELQASKNEKTEQETEGTAEEKGVEETKAKETKTKMNIDYSTPRRSVAFIGSECYPFVKTGGLGDVMYALPKELVKLNCDVKVILPRYKCIPWEYQEKMVYKGSFYMDLCSDGRKFYVGIMEYVSDGVVYDFIDNEEFFSAGNPYISLVDDIPKYCYFSKAALAALNYLNWVPDIIHCHDWQAALSPVFLRTKFKNTKLSSAQTILTIHNLKFQGIYDIPRIRYWSGLPSYVFEMGALKQNYTDANMLKGGLTYANIITTVSNTYAYEIQTREYGEHLDAHLRYHSGKLRGIVNGIDYDIWNTATDERMTVNYDITNVLEKKKLSKKKMQEELGLQVDENKFVLGLISRLTDQKGLDLVNAILPKIMDEHTQLVILGTGDSRYENAFRYYENAYKGRICSNIMYDETRSHRIYAGADAFLVPSKFEPCGLTQLIAMHCGTIPIVRETGGLKDTVEPYNKYINTGNGFTFDRYDAGLLLDAINRAKTLYFTNRWCWDEMVQRDMNKDVSWRKSAKQYKNLYLEMTP